MKIEITDPNGNVFDTISIEEPKPIVEESKTEQFLDGNLCKEFRDAVNASPIFCNDPKYLSNYNLCCAVMDRLDTCIAKLNAYGDYPDSEEEFLIFMMFACMVKDAIKELLKDLGIQQPADTQTYFTEAYKRSPVFNPNADIPTDDKFFEYLRSLMFAHPFETNRPKFLEKDETQYSPWVIVNRATRAFYNYNDPVGVRVYTNKSERILNIHFSFAVLKEYIRSKYAQLSLVTEWLKNEITEAEAKWKEIKVNRAQSPIEILKDIDKILSSRYETSYSIQDFVKYMECKLSIEDNRESVNKFKEAIIKCIPLLCDAVDNLDNERVEEICHTVLRHPRKMHQMAHYQLEKIFSYLDEKQVSSYSDNEHWGLIQAQAFADEFAKKWVQIDVEAMSYLEIKLLVHVACYLERKEQEAKL